MYVDMFSPPPEPERDRITANQTHSNILVTAVDLGDLLKQEQVISSGMESQNKAHKLSGSSEGRKIDTRP